jgi:Protein of unknown function (DUF2934)
MTTITPTTTKDQTGAPLTFATIPASELDTFIRARAYELYEQACRQDGHAEEHWRQAQAEILSSSAPGQFRDNEHWLNLMRVVQYFVRDRLEKAMAELPHYLSEHELARGSEMYRLAQPEIRRAVELLVPGLMVDFLTENPELVSRDRMPRRW